MSQILISLRTVRRAGLPHSQLLPARDGNDREMASRNVLTYNTSDRLQAATNAVRAVTPTTDANNNASKLEVTITPQLQAYRNSPPTRCQRKSAGTRCSRTTRAVARAPVIRPAIQPTVVDQGGNMHNTQALNTTSKLSNCLVQPKDQPQVNPEELVITQANPGEVEEEQEPEAKEIILANRLQAQKEGDLAKAEMFYSIYASMTNYRKRSHSSNGRRATELDITYLGTRNGTVPAPTNDPPVIVEGNLEL
ncbi:hypothetical protein H4Q26_017178 [Puccinia striiformis f. sp. tritici PST-130]|nr:hypothetical protein H4Q26_017178 [Puccinia striiformis f. sp. tritici PST-130]